MAALDRAWATDITYIRTMEGFAYLVVVIDLYSRRVVSWSMQSRQTTDVVLQALPMAVAASSRYWGNRAQKEAIQMKAYQTAAITAVLVSLAGCNPAPNKQKQVSDVTMPNGAVIRNVPVGTSREELLKKLQSAGYNTTAMLNPPLPRSYPVTPDLGSSQTPFRGRVELNYGSSRYGDLANRYRGEVESDGSVRLRNYDGDVMRGSVDPDGTVRLRNFDGDTYRGQVDPDGSMRLRSFSGSEMSGQIEPNGY